MMKRADAKRFIESRALDWMRETNYQPKPGYYPSFSDFKRWLITRGEEECLRFRSEIGAEVEAEGWFEAAIKSYWRTNRRI